MVCQEVFKQALQGDYLFVIERKCRFYNKCISTAFRFMLVYYVYQYITNKYFISHALKYENLYAGHTTQVTEKKGYTIDEAKKYPKIYTQNKRQDAMWIRKAKSKDN